MVFLLICFKPLCLIILLLPRPRRGLQGIVFTQSVCVCVCLSVCMCVSVCPANILVFYGASHDHCWCATPFGLTMTSLPILVNVTHIKYHWILGTGDIDHSDQHCTLCVLIPYNLIQLHNLSWNQSPQIMSIKV